MRAALIEELVAATDNGADTFLVVGDLGFGVIEPFREKFPARFVNAGVAEQSMVSLAAGVATQGPTVFVYSIGNFPTFRALEQIRNDIFDHNLPVAIVSVGAGFGYGTLGYSHHAIEDLAIMRAFNGVEIYSPANVVELAWSMSTILERRRPSYLRLSKDSSIFAGRLEPEIFRHGTIMRRARTERFVVLTSGSIGQETHVALGALAGSVQEVISHYSIPRFSDIAGLVGDLKSVDAIVTVEEHLASGGFGSEVPESLSESRSQAPLLRLGAEPGRRHIVGDRPFLLSQHGLDQGSLRKRMENFFDSL